MTFLPHIYTSKKNKKKKIENLHFFKSISDFLKEFGPIFDFVNEELVLKSIKIDLIKDELLKDIKCFPGYVSGFYSDKEYEDIPEIETLEIKDLEIHDYYVIKNISRDTYTIQISLAVPIVATYEQETKIEELEKFRKILCINIEIIIPNHLTIKIELFLTIKCCFSLRVL